MEHCCGPARAAQPGEGMEVAVGAPPARSLSGAVDFSSWPVIPSGTFLMGSQDPQGFIADGEGPVREVRVSGFRMSPTTVTSQEFATFVADTGYQTDAERFGWSYVFDGLIHPEARAHIKEGTVPDASWWRGVAGARWDQPAGPGSSAVADHPVVHVSFRDAEAYAHWCGARLPTEAEWEVAARGGLHQATYPWGDELTPEGEHRANIWQGTFPTTNSGEDGWVGTAPVQTFAPNGFGLYQMSGNVWEWTQDWFSPFWHQKDQPRTRIDPQGPPRGTAKVVKGGSHMCHRSYCNRYRVAARTQTTPDTTLGHTGFRLVTSV